jgi:hypothetical protein
MKLKNLFEILKKNVVQQIIISALLIIFSIFFYLLIPSNYKTTILVTPLSDLQFKDNFFIPESNNLNFSVSNEVKIENLKIENSNTDSINNLNLSPLNLFYSFFKDTEKIIESSYNTEKIIINFYGSSYEYFYSIEINSESKKNNIKKLIKLLSDVESQVYERFINYEKNYNKKILLNKKNLNFVNYFNNKIVHNKNKMNIYFYLCLIILISFIINLLILKIKKKI